MISYGVRRRGEIFHVEAMSGEGKAQNEDAVGVRLVTFNYVHVGSGGLCRVRSVSQALLVNWCSVGK